MNKPCLQIVLFKQLGLSVAIWNASKQHVHKWESYEELNSPEAILIETVISKHTVICCNRIEPKQSTWQIAKVPNSVKRRAVNSTNHADL